MQSETFRKWLEDRGCRFEKTERARGGLGHSVITVRRGERSTTLPAAGARDDLDPGEILRVVEDLGLNWSELPGPSSRT